MIEAQHLRKEYGETVAVADVSFHVGKGEVLGFLGPNAAGKTTTMRMLTGFLPPTAGRASIAGLDVTDNPLKARRHIGYLPENVPLYDEMSVSRYLGFMARLKDVPGSKIKSRVQEVMQAVHIQDRARQPIGKLSKGLRQRVGIAQAMVHDPDVLILDEPTVGLDPHQVIEVRELIRSLGKDHTIILSTHILSEASMVCDRIVIINEGSIIAEDTPQALTARLLQGQQVELIIRGPAREIAQVLEAVPGVAAVSVKPADQKTISGKVQPRIALELGDTAEDREEPQSGKSTPPPGAPGASDSPPEQPSRISGNGKDSGPPDSSRAGSKSSTPPAPASSRDRPLAGGPEIQQYILQAQSGQDIREGAAAAIIRGGWGLLELRQVSLSLEEIFLRMTGPGEETEG